MVFIPVNSSHKLHTAIDCQTRCLLFALVTPFYFGISLARGKKPAGYFPAGSELFDKFFVEIDMVFPVAQRSEADG
jgi:hypothetical protein